MSATSTTGPPGSSLCSSGPALLGLAAAEDLEAVVERRRLGHAVHAEREAVEGAARIGEVLRAVCGGSTLRRVGIHLDVVVAAIPGGLFGAPGLGRAGVVEPVFDLVGLVDVAQRHVVHQPAQRLELLAGGQAVQLRHMPSTPVCISSTRYATPASSSAARVRSRAWASSSMTRAVPAPYHGRP